MTEAQLKKQILTPQFQDALVIAGLYDAGLEQYAEGSINLDQFQKRIANIWRGLPPDKDTKKGDVTDKYGNIAGMSGADLQNRMQKGLLSN
jgi:muramidase (phage lysozyme)